MPLRYFGTELRLVCANAYPQAEGAFPTQGDEGRAFQALNQHIMVPLPGIPALLADLRAPEGVEVNMPRNVRIPMRIYACDTCGYVEMYLEKRPPKQGSGSGEGHG